MIMLACIIHLTENTKKRRVGGEKRVNYIYNDIGKNKKKRAKQSI